MFSSNSLDKNCVGPDNCPSGRNNAARFPVGMTSLGDENQQIRIQLAVHKYNSSVNSQPSTRCSVVSPVRHSFLKNSLKANTLEGDTERTLKIEKKNENKYEGVGAFPTIHLKRSAIRYRPIKRCNDVKIPYPELPVNRFLSHLPEVHSDLKSNARSVLDVLEDLSGKKIHSNEENKSKLKGLGGDSLPNLNAVYKPLFVQKPKISSVLTRDNTTQTLFPADIEASNAHLSLSVIRNDTSDPRTELRRKLAKQNNEIFASLSSSISSSFALKRKIEKVLPSKNDNQLLEGTVSKKSKISDHQYKNFNTNGDSRTMNRPRVKSDGLVKLNRKNQSSSEANIPTSPNKDRLTTIFLDMQNTSPKAQLFESNSTSTETHRNNGFVPTVKTFEKESKSTVVEDFSEPDTNESSFKSSSNVDLSSPKNEQNEHQSNHVFNFPNNKTNLTQSDILKSTPSGFQFNANVANASSFSFQKTSVGNDSTPSDNSTNTKIGITQITESSGNEVEAPNKNYVSGSSSEKPDFSSFKFGAEGTQPSTMSPSLNNPESSKQKIFEVPPVSATTAPIVTPQFHFSTATVTSTSSITSTTVFGTPVTKNNVNNPTKPLFTFGSNESLGQQPLETPKTDENIKTPNSLLTSIPSTTQSIQSNTFTFGQKVISESPNKIISDQNAANIATPTSQTNINSFSPSASASNTNSAPKNLSDKSLFTFGPRAEISSTSSFAVTTIQEPKFVFSFGQKSDTKQDQVPETQKNSNLFSFDQKSNSQESSPNSTLATNVPTSGQPHTTQASSLFGYNVPQTTITFEQVLAPHSSDRTNQLNFGTKSEGESPGNMTKFASSQNNIDFPVKTSLFAPSVSGFPSDTTQASIGFGTTTSSASGLKFEASTSTQSTPHFTVSSATKTIPVFGASSTSQSFTGFGSSSTTQSTGAFGALAPNPTSKFGETHHTSFTLGVSSTPQSVPKFGATSTTQSTLTFGTSSTSQSTSTFANPSTVQSTSTFGASSTSSLTTSGFGAPASTQSALRFGSSSAQDNTSFGASTGFSTASSTISSNSFGASTATSALGFGTSQTSFGQPFGNKPPATSLGQTSNIFGQNPAPSFSSTTTFSSNQGNVFGQKLNTDGNVFDQNKIQGPGFSATTQPFNAQNKFSFGMSTSNTTGFTNSPPNTTAAPVFSFGANPTGSTFTFGSSTSGLSNTQAPFAFKSSTNEPFKFGSSTTKEVSSFGSTNSSTFTFNGQMNNNHLGEQKSTFSFGSTQASSSSPFNFGTTPSPSVFSFGGSTSSASSTSSFNFGTPTPGGPFGQATTATGAPFPVPGTFSIGSGSSQSRPRATSRPRRRP